MKMKAPPKKSDEPRKARLPQGRLAQLPDPCVQVMEVK
jgi:hypothetical protein